MTWVVAAIRARSVARARGLVRHGGSGVASSLVGRYRHSSACALVKADDVVVDFVDADVEDVDVADVDDVSTPTTTAIAPTMPSTPTTSTTTSSDFTGQDNEAT